MSNTAQPVKRPTFLIVPFSMKAQVDAMVKKSGLVLLDSTDKPVIDIPGAGPVHRP